MWLCQFNFKYTFHFTDEDYPEQQMEPSHLLPQRTPKYLELMYDSDSGAGTVYDGYEIPRTPMTYLPFSRHSIIGVAPNRLIKPPIYRTHSLRTHTRPPNATIIPLRNGIMKRASLCEGIQSSFVQEPRPTSSREKTLDTDFDKHTFKTPFWTVILIVRLFTYLYITPPIFKSFYTRVIYFIW